MEKFIFSRRRQAGSRLVAQAHWYETLLFNRERSPWRQLVVVPVQLDARTHWEDSEAVLWTATKRVEDLTYVILCRKSRDFPFAVYLTCLWDPITFCVCVMDKEDWDSGSTYHTGYRPNSVKCWTLSLNSLSVGAVSSALAEFNSVLPEQEATMGSISRNLIRASYHNQHRCNQSSSQRYNDIVVQFRAEGMLNI